MSGFEDLTLDTRTLSERLHLADLDKWQRVRSAWADHGDGSLDSIPVDAFYDRIRTYASITPHPNAVALEDELMEFISEGSLRYAASLVLRTDEIMLMEGKGDAGELCMLDSIAPPDTGVVERQSTLNGNQIACLASNIVLYTTLPDEEEWSYPPLECDQTYGTANGITALRSLLFLIRQSRKSPLRSLQISRTRVAASYIDVLLLQHGHRSLPIVNWCTCGESIAQVDRDGRPDTCSRVIFSDTYIGGAVLGKGSGQEEGLMREHPATIASLLVCMKMARSEAIVIRGHSELRLETCEFRELESPAFVFIDAMPYAYFPGLDQFCVNEMRSEITKALAGLSVAPGESLYTAAWGCGAFGGNMELKLLLQLLACGLTCKASMMFERDFCYHFANPDGDGPKLVRMLEDNGITTCGRLWEFLVSYGALPLKERQGSLLEAAANFK
jgi:hypothetical protein